MKKISITTRHDDYRSFDLLTTAMICPKALLRTR